MATRIAIGGIRGRMGQELLAAGRDLDGVDVVGGIVRPGSLAGFNSNLPEIALIEAVEELLPRIDVLVDFTTPDVTIAHARSCAAVGRPFVSGVTGLSANQIEELGDLGQRVPIFYARNMSVGLNALLSMLPTLVRALDGYDVEILETHHRHKADAPSGTALALAEKVAAARDASLGDRAVYGRHGAASRSPGEIGIHAVRGGGNAGEHVVLLADEGEEIRIAHRAYSRRTFALGALRAALFVHGRAPGYYTMHDLTAATGAVI